MKLYEVPNNTKVRIIETPNLPPSAVDIKENEVLKFFHIDGMYSYCKNEEGKLVHPAAWTEVEIVK